MRVAVVSNRNRPGFPDDNLKDHLKWIRRAANEGARLVLFPELSLSGYTTRPFVRKIGVKLNSPHCVSLVRSARESKMVVAFGMPLQRRNRLYISHVIAGPEGIIGHYEKVHLAGAARGEGRVFTEGDEFKAFDVGGVCVGINICYDGRHPGSSLAVAHLGAEVILHPHGNTVGRLGANPVGWTANKKAYLGARSVDTCSYTLICNSVGNVKDRDGKLVLAKSNERDIDTKKKWPKDLTTAIYTAEDNPPGDSKDPFPNDRRKAMKKGAEALKPENSPKNMPKPAEKQAAE